MVAIATPNPRSIPVPGSLPSRSRPRLQLVDDRRRPPASGTGRSRLAAAVAVAVVVLGLVFLALLGPAPTAASGEIPVLDTTRVVVEGETMWSIARDVAPAGETALYVERLVEVNGGGAVEPGQVVVLPVP